MTASVVQEKNTFTTGTGVTSISLAFTSNVSAGNTVHAISSSGATTTTHTYSDGVNTYTQLDHVADTNHNQDFNHGYAKNVAAGTTWTVANQVKVTFSVLVAFDGLLIREIGGVSITPLDGHNAKDVLGSSTSISVTATNASQPALISAAAFDPSGTVTTISSTTGIQDVNNGWSTTGPGVVGDQHNRVTTATTQTASFSTGSSVPLAALIAIFDEAAAGGVSAALTGQSAAFTAGTLPPNTSVSLTGQLATFTPGVLTPGLSEALTGQIASFVSGTLVPSTTVPLVGQLAVFTPGNVNAGSDVTAVLSGQAASFTAGALAPSISTALTGQAATFAPGTMSMGISGALTGSAANFNPGLITASGGAQVNNAFGTIQILWRVR